MSTKTGLILGGSRDLTNYATVTACAVDASVPSGCDLRVAFKAGDGNFQKYDTAKNEWADLATQNITADSLINEGNTKAEIESLASSELAVFAGKNVNIAVALSMDDTKEDAPSVGKISFTGTALDSYKDVVYSDAILLSDYDMAVDILAIDVDKTEEGGGRVAVEASILDENGAWSGYEDYLAAVSNKVPAKAIKFKGILTVTALGGASRAVLNSISIRHRTDNVAVFSEGTGVLITKTKNFVNTIGRAHAMIKHPVVKDTEFRISVSLRDEPVTVTNEALGTGDGEPRTVTLANTENLASHGFVLCFDGVPQAASAYSFSTADGKVTYNAPEGAAVTADYIYGWTPEKFVKMTQDTVYPDSNDNNLVDDQFDYIALSDGDLKGSVGVLKIEIEQKSGAVRNEILGTGTGALQAFQLGHHAKPETISVSPSGAAWRYNENTDMLLVTAADGEEISASYDWAARTNYIESIGCIFNP